ncbi:DUF2805 domain-containing protein [Roseinatronobacter sp. NSM]|uniref:DUF2805 domain-containing protein n=1 Tax=Roseinatronobacter sp. NSM TaxID=3457785 RepID=UPI004035B719
MKKQVLDIETVSEIVEMALSDKASFHDILTLHGLGADEVKSLMRRSLKPGSYRAWRRRVRQFSDRREVYK